MPKQPKTPTLSSDSPRALPKNKEALSVLLRAVEKLLNFLEPQLHQQQMRLKELQKTLTRPWNIVEQRPFLEAMAKASLNRFAQGGPSASAVMPFVDRAGFAAVRESKGRRRETAGLRACQAKPRPGLEALY